jgi:hypothetical protein
MKNNQLTAVFLALFFLSTAANVWVIFQYNSTFHKAQRIQSNVMGLNVVQLLYNESAEYGKTHPDMAHLLQTTGVGTANKPAAPAMNKPAK